MCFLVK